MPMPAKPHSGWFVFVVTLLGWDFTLLSQSQRVRDYSDPIELYITSGGMYFGHAKVTENVILGLASRLKDPAYPWSQRQLVSAIKIALSNIPASEQVRMVGRDALYGKLESDDPILRRFTVQCVSSLDRADATSALLKMVNDPDKSVRIVTFEALADVGAPEQAAALEEALRERVAKLAPDELREDSSLDYGRMAVQRLKDRARYPDAEFLPIGHGPSGPLPKGTLTPPRPQKVRDGLLIPDLSSLPETPRNGTPLGEEGSSPPDSPSASRIEGLTLQPAPPFRAEAKPSTPNAPSKLDDNRPESLIVPGVGIATLTVSVWLYFRWRRRSGS